ncbi:MAG TPA: DUF6675 family protein [Reyranella sp.]|nr:DUF6675 family protein [Reyranella sp.]
MLALVPSVAAAQQSAQQAFALSPPCQGPPRPGYGEIGGAPAIATWSEADSRAWQAAPCLQWNAGAHPRMVTALAASLHATSLDDLLARYGALSRYNTIRYWSTLRQAWDELVSHAGFTDGPAANYSHPDLTPDQFATGREFYYYEIDHVGRTVHRLTVRRRTADSVELATENLTPVRFGIFTIFEPHALRTATFIDRRGPNDWGYYQTIGVGEGSDFIAVRSASPYINRLTAFYRYMAGIPTDSLPPAAPH